jgi:hypothetical protein
MCASATEHALVQVITPTLRELRGCAFGDARALAADPCARVLVNSETHKWLGAAPGDEPRPHAQLNKPDLFLTYMPFWQRRADGGGAAVGRLAHPVLVADGCVPEMFEAKFGDGVLTTAALGQLVDFQQRVPGVCRGALFNACHLWLYESLDGMPQRLVQTTWDARGARALVLGFFDAPRTEPPLIGVARTIMLSLDVVPADARAGEGSFLGAGGSGRVFCTAPRAGGSARYALKLSCRASADDLDVEFALLTAAAAAGAPVVSVVARSLRSAMGAGDRRAGGGYLMRDVLRPVRAITPARCRDAFRALALLHMRGLAHGDARVPNLLLTLSGRGSFVWADPCGTRGATLAAAQAADARQLAASVLGLCEGDAAAPGGAAVFATAHAAIAASLVAAAAAGTRTETVYDGVGGAVADALEKDRVP